EVGRAGLTRSCAEGASVPALTVWITQRPMPLERTRVEYRHGEDSRARECRGKARPHDLNLWKLGHSFYDLFLRLRRDARCASSCAMRSRDASSSATFLLVPSPRPTNPSSSTFDV